MPKPEDYSIMGFWYSSSGSYPYFIKAQQIKACEANAPLNAIYQSYSGEWKTTDDLAKDHWFHHELLEFQRHQGKK